MNFRTLLIDDEKLAINRLSRLLQEYDTFSIIGEAYNGIEGLKLIEELKPDLIFLDIEMPGMNGFEMLSELKHMPMVVFATAFDTYAIRAFEENSIDYLLKPVEKERLDITVQKLSKSRQPFDSSYFLNMLEQMKPKKEMVSISVKTGDRIFLLRMEEVSHFEAEDKYTYLTTLDGRKFITDYTLTYLEEKLPSQFMRISRSNIINSHMVKEIQKHFSGKYMFFLNDKNASKILSSSKYSDNVKKLISL